MIVNKLRAGVKVVAVKAPGFGENRKSNLQDIAILTGGEVISEDLGHKLEKVELEQLGQVKKVTVTKDDTILLHGGGEGWSDYPATAELLSSFHTLLLLPISSVIRCVAHAGRL